MAHDVEGLQANMKALQKKLADLGSHKHFAEFHNMTSQPWWTSKQDAFFVNALVSSLQGQVENVAMQLDKLIEGSRLIEKE